MSQCLVNEEFNNDDRAVEDVTVNITSELKSTCLQSTALFSATHEVKFRSNRNQLIKTGMRITNYPYKIIIENRVNDRQSIASQLKISTGDFLLAVNNEDVHFLEGNIEHVLELFTRHQMPFTLNLIVHRPHRQAEVMSITEQYTASSEILGPTQSVVTSESYWGHTEKWQSSTEARYHPYLSSEVQLSIDENYTLFPRVKVNHIRITPAIAYTKLLTELPVVPHRPNIRVSHHETTSVKIYFQRLLNEDTTVNVYLHSAKTPFFRLYDHAEMIDWDMNQYMYTGRNRPTDSGFPVILSNTQTGQLQFNDNVISVENGQDAHDFLNISAVDGRFFQRQGFTDGSGLKVLQSVAHPFYFIARSLLEEVEGTSNFECQKLHHVEPLSCIPDRAKFLIQ